MILKKVSGHIKTTLSTGVIIILAWSLDNGTYRHNSAIYLN